MPFVVDTLTPDRLPAFRDLLEVGGMLAEESGFRDFWLDVLDAPFRRHLEFLIAGSEGEVHGFAAAARRPQGPDGYRSVIGWVRRDRRRQGIGTALLKAMGPRLAARGIARQATSIDESWDGSRLFLEANGFEVDSVSYVIGYVGDPYMSAPVDGVRCFVYAGGDARLNDEVSDFHNRYLARESGVSVMTGELIEYLVTNEDAWMMVAADEASGSVVGLLLCSGGNFFSNIAVARRYWGTGLADWVGSLAIDHCLRTGNDSPWSFVRPTNRAPLALLERNNWRKLATRVFYIAPTSPAP